MLDKEWLDAMIRRRSNEGRTLSIEKIDGEKYNKWHIKKQADKFYGGWTKALIANSVSPNERYDVSKEDVTQELLRLKSEGHSMKTRDFEKWLYYGITKHFGGYKKAKEALGIETKYSYTDARRKRDLAKRKYDEEDLSLILRDYVDAGKTRNEIYSDAKLLSALYKRGYNLETFAKKFEIILPDKEYNGVADIFIQCGHRFENALDELFALAGIHFEKYAHYRWRPDYVLANNVWADAKLTFSRVAHKDVYSRYIKHCDYLWLIHLRGPRGATRLYDRCSSISAYDLLVLVDDHHAREKLKKEFNSIIKDAKAEISA